MNAVAQKFQKQGHPLMNGTACKECYLKVGEAKHQKAEAGVKVMVGLAEVAEGRTALVVILRCRVSRTDGAQVIAMGGNEDATLKHITSVWPTFPHDRQNDVRVAADLVTIVDRSGDDMVNAVRDLHEGGFFERARKAVYGAIPRGQHAAKPEVLVKWIEAHVQQFVDARVGQDDPAHQLEQLEKWHAAASTALALEYKTKKAELKAKLPKGKKKAAKKPRYKANPLPAMLCTNQQAQTAAEGLASHPAVAPAKGSGPVLAVDNSKDGQQDHDLKDDAHPASE